MPLPVAHGLAGAAIVAILTPAKSIIPKWKLVLTGGLLAVFPDLDFFFDWVFNLGSYWHKGFMHSIVFAGALGLITAASIRAKHVQEILALILAASSHGLLDALGTISSNGGVELLWPFSSLRIYFGLFNYPDFDYSPRIYPFTFFFSEMIKMCLIELLIFSPLFLIILWLMRKRYRGFMAG